MLLEGIEECRTALVGHDALFDRLLEDHGCLHQAVSPDRLADLLDATCRYLKKAADVNGKLDLGKRNKEGSSLAGDRGLDSTTGESTGSSASVSPAEITERTAYEIADACVGGVSPCKAVASDAVTLLCSMLEDLFSETPWSEWDSTIEVVNKVIVQLQANALRIIGRVQEVDELIKAWMRETGRLIWTIGLKEVAALAQLRREERKIGVPTEKVVEELNSVPDSPCASTAASSCGDVGWGDTTDLVWQPGFLKRRSYADRARSRDVNIKRT
jgi:hypothetical protein